MRFSQLVWVLAAACAACHDGGSGTRPLPSDLAGSDGSALLRIDASTAAASVRSGPGLAGFTAFYGTGVGSTAFAVRALARFP